MRERVEFTSVDQLERMGKRMRGEEGANGGGVVDVKIVPGVGHFQLGKPRLRRARRTDGFELAGLDSSVVHWVVISLDVYFCC